MRAAPLLKALSVAIGLSQSVVGAAQTQAELRQLRRNVETADSSKWAGARVEARWKLAEIERPVKAIALLKEAASLADSSGLIPLELESRTRLRDAFAEGKDWKNAFAQSLLAQGLTERRDAATASTALHGAFTEIERAQARADSIAQVLRQERLNAEQALLHAGHETRSWMWVSVGAVIIGAVSCLVLWLGGRGRHRRLADDVKALQARIDALEQPRNRVREEVLPLTGTIAAEPPAHPEDILPQPVFDPEVLAHLRKRAPERLATFREARARGDWEKAVRVVHTLKPVLAGLDEPRFAPLCARLVAEGTAGSPTWLTDADSLESALDDLLSAS